MEDHIAPYIKQGYAHNHDNTEEAKKGDNKMKILSDYERGMLEVALDAEGELAIRLSKKTRRTDIKMTIVNTNLAWLQMLQSHFGGKIATKSYNKNRNKLPAYQLWFTRKEMRELLPQIKLVIKEDNRIRILNYLDHCVLCIRRFLKPYKVRKEGGLKSVIH